MPDLDVRLARHRAELFDAIDQPPLGHLRQRATARSRRRRAALGGGLLVVAVAATLLVHPWSGDQPPPVAGIPPEAPAYTAAGITVNGLTGSGVLQVRGDIVDVEFTDPDHGYLLARCRVPASCGAVLARTTDGGLTWVGEAVPVPAASGEPTDLLAFPGGRLALDGVGYVSDDGGRNWRLTTAADIATPIPARPGDLLRLGPYAQPGRCGGPVEVWQPGFLRGGTTLSQPDLEVCWVAPVADVDDAWWAGGTRSGRAAVSVTGDRGASWRTVVLDAPGDAVTSVEVARLGSHAYAVVLGPGRTISAIFHSADGGRTFTRTRGSGAGDPQGLAGAVVPLLDGRLLAAGADRRWYVSTDDGATFQRAEGTLPAVGHLARTSAGYVAYDLFGGGWAAFSPDGSTWRKLQVN